MIRKGRLLIVVFTTLSLFLVSCGKENSLDSESDLVITNGNLFLENSKRSPIKSSLDMAKGIAKVGGCTGFFLQNEDDENYIASATHCFQYEAKRWCNRGSFATDYYNNVRLKCKAVVAGNKKHDFVIFKFENSQRDRSMDFKLADFELKKGLYLGMLGFPGDHHNKYNDLMLTEHCWVQVPFTEFNIYNNIPTPDDGNFKHNCSTYGGNSGGPIFIDGTRVAVGMPDQYQHSTYNQASTVQSQGVLISKFVNDFRYEINNKKIALERISPESETRVLTKSVFQSSDQQSCLLTVEKVNYDTKSYPVEVHVNVSNSSGSLCDFSEGDKFYYKCNSSGSCSESDHHTTLKVESAHKLYWLVDSEKEIELLKI